MHKVEVQLANERRAETANGQSVYPRYTQSNRGEGKRPGGLLQAHCNMLGRRRTQRMASDKL